MKNTIKLIDILKEWVDTLPEETKEKLAVNEVIDETN